MIYTVKFYSDVEENECFESILHRINNFISEKGIERDNIIEYSTRTKEVTYYKMIGSEQRKQYTIILSYWEDWEESSYDVCEFDVFDECNQ